MNTIYITTRLNKKNNVHCKKCPMFTTRQNVYYEQQGFNPTVLILGANPGYEEGKQQRPFIGEAGKILRDCIENKFNEFVITNAILCVTSNTSKIPDLDQTLIHCRRYWYSLFLRIQPKLLIVLGRIAYNSVVKSIQTNYPEKVPMTTITHVTTIQNMNGTSCKIYTLPHPSYILRGNMSKEEYNQLFNRITI